MPGNDFGAHRHLGGREAKRLARDIIRHAGYLINDSAWLDRRDPMVDRAFAAAHASFCRAGGYRFIREYANPQLSASSGIAGHRSATGFNLPRGHPSGLGGLEPVVTEI